MTRAAGTKPVRLRVAIDESPKGSGPHSAGDYTAYQVFGPAALPLFCVDPETDNCVPYGCAAHAVEEDGCVHSFQVGEHRYGDGTLVSASDYERTLSDAASEAGGLGVFLRGLASMSAKGDTLKLRFEAPNFVVPRILSMVNLSPTHPHRSSETAGRYLPRAQGRGEWVLERDRQVRQAGDRREVDEIHYRLVPDRWRNVALYESGEIDLTCDTMFPYSEVSHYEGRPDFFERPAPLFVTLQVVSDSHWALKDPARRRCLADAIARAAIASRFEGLLEPNRSFEWGRSLAIVGAGDPAEARDQLQRSSDSAPLRIGYHDFFPNLSILEHIANDLRMAGVETLAVPQNYRTLEFRDCHLVLAILVPRFMDPYALHLTSALCNPALEDPAAWRPYLEALDTHVQESDASKRRELVPRLGQQLYALSPRIPLFQMHRLFLRRPEFEHHAFLPAFPQVVLDQ